MAVKKQNIINNQWVLLCVFTLIACTISAQNSAEYFPSDSLKYALLKKQTINYERVDWTTIRKNRNDMPIFCKWELDIQDATNIPVKFRLGSQEYVDRLENKGTMKID